MLLPQWRILAVCALTLFAPVCALAQHHAIAPSMTANYGQAARMLTAPPVPTPGLFTNPTYRVPVYSYPTNTVPSALPPTQGVFRPAAGAGADDLSLRLNGPEGDDEEMRPPIGPPAAPVYRPRPGEDLMASSTAASNAPAAKMATVVINVPATAQVWFDNNLTRTMGSQRSFETPLLTPGQTYRYEVKARWLQDGKPVERTFNVSVRPGEQTVVDFVAPPANP